MHWFISLFLHLISQNKMASASNFRTSLRPHNVIYTRATFSQTKEMISHGCNAFQCHVMHANQGQDKAFSSKSNVQTARDSHDLNMDVAASNSFA